MTSIYENAKGKGERYRSEPRSLQRRMRSEAVVTEVSSTARRMGPPSKKALDLREQTQDNPV